MNPMDRVLLRLVAVAIFALAFIAPVRAQMPELNLKFDKLEQALDLSPAQKEQYELAVGATKRMLFQVALVGLQVKERLAAELAKPRPDFSSLEEARRAIVEDGRTLRREARDEWRKLYAMLDEAQVRALRRFADDQFENAGLLHEFMQQLILGGRAP
jgi:hypothetical protein